MILQTAPRQVPRRAKGGEIGPVQLLLTRFSVHLPYESIPYCFDFRQVLQRFPIKSKISLTIIMDEHREGNTMVSSEGLLNLYEGV